MKPNCIKILIIMLSFISIISNAQGLNFSDSIGRKQGEWREYYDKGKSKIKASREYLNNVLNGKVKYYTKKGLIKSTLYYSNGRLLFYKTHKIKGDDIGKAYKFSGRRIDYTRSKYMYENLPVNDSFINYSDSLGQKQGVWHEILVGSLLFPYSEEYYCVGNYKNGKKEGTFKYYLYDGKQLSCEANFQNDILEGPCISYYLSGNPAVIYNFSKGIKNGPYISFFENSAIREKGEMKDGSFVGEYYRYNKKGKLVCFIKDAKIKSPLDY